MNFNLATIKIKNLRLRTYIGINEDEIKNKQDVVVNVKIDYDAEKATNTDDMSDALNYKTITKAIIKFVEDNRFSLLEKLTADVLSIAAEHFRCATLRLRSISHMPLDFLIPCP